MNVTIGNTIYEAKLIETTPDRVEVGFVERWTLFIEDEYVGRLARWKTGQYAFISKPGEADILNLSDYPHIVQ